MSLKWIGTVMIVLCCGGFGFRLVSIHRQREKELRDLLAALDLLESELRYRLSPLPDLCCLVANSINGSIGRLFLTLYEELEHQIAPDAGCCMNVAVSHSNLTSDTIRLLRELGRTLGRFDLDGQIQGIESVRNEALLALDKLTKDQDARLRSYQTLGLCAGAALAILLL